MDDQRAARGARSARAHRRHDPQPRARHRRASLPGGDRATRGGSVHPGVRPRDHAHRRQPSLPHGAVHRPRDGGAGRRAHPPPRADQGDPHQALRLQGLDRRGDRRVDQAVQQDLHSASNFSSQSTAAQAAAVAAAAQASGMNQNAIAAADKVTTYPLFFMKIFKKFLCQFYR